MKLNHFKVYQNDLENDLSNEERGDFGRLIRAIISAERPQSNDVNNDLAKKEAQELYDVKNLFQTFAYYLI